MADREVKMERSTTLPKRCAASRCKKRYKSIGTSANLRACHVCGRGLCRYCQEVIINPEITHWETVAENYNPHGEQRPISFYRLMPGELYDYYDYVAFCSKCTKKPLPALLVKNDRERKATLILPDQ